MFGSLIEVCSSLNGLGAWRKEGEKGGNGGRRGLRCQRRASHVRRSCGPWVGEGFVEPGLRIALCC